MEIDSDKLIENAIRAGLVEGVKARLTSGYGSPTAKILDAAIEKHAPKMKAILEESIASCVTAPEFCEEIAGAVRALMAKTLIQRFGGEIEKQVNALKSDPTTRARITLAIEEIVKTKAN